MNKADFEAEVNHPAHYTNGPVCPHCGNTIECITITAPMNFCLGNVIKYIWRAGLKGPELTDILKARQYLDFEIERRNREKPSDQK